MKPVLLFLVLILAFICGDNVLELLGYHHRDFSSSPVFRLHPLSYLAFAIVVVYLINGKIGMAELVGKMKTEAIFLLGAILILCYLQITGNLNAIAFFIDALILPVLLSMLLKITSVSVLYKFRNWVYLLFFANAGIAVIEKLRGAFLIARESAWLFDYFRSSAIFGHPLNNALIMSVLTITLFLAAQNTWLKLSVLFAGMVSIFCFGARGALIGVFIGIMLHMFLGATGGSKTDKKEAVNGLVYLMAFAGIILIVINFTSFGDRITALSHVDGSAEARVDSFNIISQINFSDLIWKGTSTQEMERIQNASGVEIIENFYLIWLLRFGLIVTALLIWGLARFLLDVTKTSPADIKFPILLAFIFVSSTNNSLSTSTLVISNMILAYYILLSFKVVREDEFTIKPINYESLPY
ncbi:VpsF family polysaccharide biosynthesis protein [Mucilaginibacter lutimaris]|uniref:VpsF family polysaccharide biosynthesis protein n=1 Tax=Mucilaginibacter lutimaris TaxID=931629 RepID=A0ABW2ZKV0_9SPHI